MTLSLTLSRGWDWPGLWYEEHGTQDSQTWEHSATVYLAWLTIRLSWYVPSRGRTYRDIYHWPPVRG